MTAAGVASLLSRAAGLELACFREEHVAKSVERAMAREGAPDAVALAGLIARDERARLRFRRAVAVPYTGLFRDPAQFELLARDLLPPLVAEGRELAVWSAGCADGSELASVALLLDRLGALEGTLLLGSDVLEENIAAARAGVYGGTALPLRIRRRLRWERRDVAVEEPPPGQWDVVLCRNVAIYLAAEARRALDRKLAGALAPRGVLLLGRSERLLDASALGLARAGPHAYRRTP